MFAVRYCAYNAISLRRQKTESSAHLSGKGKILKLTIMFYNNLAELSKDYPDLNVTVKLGELIEVVEYCVNFTRSNLEQIIQDESQEKYLSPQKTAELFDVNLSTLWRWQKQGYLTPIELGGKRKYRQSDIDKILKKGATV